MLADRAGRRDAEEEKGHGGQRRKSRQQGLEEAEQGWRVCVNRNYLLRTFSSAS